jgi:ubiquinone/menaquinone biosynthesis C-methylase UbiE
MALLEARDYQVFGVDISQGMIREALGRGVKASVLGDLRYLPCRPAVFDGAFSMHGGLSHLPTMKEKTAALREIDRALKRRCVLMIDVPNPYRKDRGETYTV